MYYLYKVSLKIGKRTIVLNLYSKSLADVTLFCVNNLAAEISTVYKVEYEAPKSKIYPVDDPSLYKRTAYFNVRDSAASVSAVLSLQTIKLTRSYQEVFDDMCLLLGTSPSTGIDAHVAITESTK